MNMLTKLIPFLALVFFPDANSESSKSKLMLKKFIGKGVISCESYNGGRFIFDFNKGLTGNKELHPSQKIVEVRCNDDPKDRSDTGCQITMNGSTDTYGTSIIKYYFNFEFVLTHWESVFIEHEKEVNVSNTYRGLQFGSTSTSTLRVASPYISLFVTKKSPSVWYSCE